MADGNKPVTPEDAAASLEARLSRRAARRQARQQLDAEKLKLLAAEAEKGRAEIAAEEAKAVEAEEAKKPAKQAPPPATIEQNKPPALKQAADIAVIDEEAFEAARRAREARMRQIRGELRRRRRWRAFWMLVRFAVFVLGPTALVGWYYYEKATDMYVSESTMVFKSGSSQSTGGGLLGALTGSSPTDSVALQEYIMSRDILQRLDKDHGIVSHFQAEDIDWLHRLDPSATFDDAYKYYAGGFIMPGKVKVSYDIAEGIIRLEIVAASAEAAHRFNKAIIGYGEERVNALNERSRGDGVRMANDQVAKARADLLDAERKVAAVQEAQNSFSATGEAAAIQGEITALEAELRAIEAQIEQLKTITNDPNDSRFVTYRTQKRILEDQIAVLRSRLTGGGDRATGDRSMAQLSSELRLAETDLMAANMMYQSALTSREAALQVAAEQSLFLEVVTQPTLPQKATRPKRLQNTGLVFLVLFATYIIGLLTFSLIREQAAI